MESTEVANEGSPPRIWGRASQVSLPTFLSCLALLTTSPLIVFYFYIVAFHFECSLLAPAQTWWQGEMTLSEFTSLIPKPSLIGVGICAIWMSLQVVLAILPDGIDVFKLNRFFPGYQGGNHLGAVTPAGNRLTYRINGLQAWAISHLLFFIGAFGFEWFSPTILFDHWGALLWVMNGIGFVLAAFVYLKAYLFPSFRTDRKFSGSLLYDFFMGIELNPRIGLIDLKLFFNGRPGIVAWTLINISFASAQYAHYGYVTNSMWILNLLQGMYVLYFFWKEAWYLKTIDIHHDHFGWMLAWGDCVWLPYMYTLQGLFLVFHPVQLSMEYAIGILVLGLGGFYIFASANNQKDKFRRLEGEGLIWGRKPVSIPCEYMTQDGEIRKSSLLVSGWWGLSRHMNYTGDLLLSLAYSLVCGGTYLFPYFYFVFLSILLIHRCIRDEKRCRDKYGAPWIEYCQQVPYRLIPYIW
jgi:7-dehydrocholesterol reductase